MDTSLINYSILLAAVVALLTFKRMKSYMSPYILLLVLAFLYTLFAKYYLSGGWQFLNLRIDNIQDTLFATLIFTLLGTLTIVAIRAKRKKFETLKWLTSLVSLYLLFGIIQKIFFQAIVTSTINNLIENTNIVVISSGLFFALFHWGWGSKSIRFGILSFIAGVVWAILFLKSPNILLLGASHAVLAGFYYSLVYEGNILQKKFTKTN